MLKSYSQGKANRSNNKFNTPHDELPLSVASNVGELQIVLIGKVTPSGFFCN